MYLGLLTGGSPKCGYSHVGGNTNNRSFNLGVNSFVDEEKSVLPPVNQHHSNKQ